MKSGIVLSRNCPLVCHAVWMVVIYAIESWLSLRYRSAAIYLETAREAYEAFVLWSFYRLLLSFLAAEHGIGWVVATPSGTTTLATREQAVRAGLGSDVVMGAIMRHSCNEAILRRKEPQDKLSGVLGGDVHRKGEGDVVHLSESGRGATPRAAVAPTDSGAAEEKGDEDLVSVHIAPCCCLPAWRIGTPFLHWTRMAVFQYVIVRLVCTLLTLVLTPLDLYGEGEFSNMGKFYFYSVVAINLSQCWALYCLALVYFRFKKALHGLQPTKKFLVIKAIVFLCWWQGMVVSGMASAGWLEGTTQWTSDEVQRGLQDFLICVEMAIIAMVHHRVYSYLDFVPSEQSKTPLLAASASPAGGDCALPEGSAVATQPPGAGYAPRERPVRQPFLAAVANMLPGDVVRDVPRVLGPRQVSSTEIVLSPPCAAQTPAPGGAPTGESVPGLAGAGAEPPA